MKENGKPDLNPTNCRLIEVYYNKLIKLIGTVTSEANVQIKKLETTPLADTVVVMNKRLSLREFIFLMNRMHNATVPKRNNLAIEDMVLSKKHFIGAAIRTAEEFLVETLIVKLPHRPEIIEEINQYREKEKERYVSKVQQKVQQVSM